MYLAEISSDPLKLLEIDGKGFRKKHQISSDQFPYFLRDNLHNFKNLIPELDMNGKIINLESLIIDYYVVKNRYNNIAIFSLFVITDDQKLIFQKMGTRLTAISFDQDDNEFEIRLSSFTDSKVNNHYLSDYLRS